MKPYEYQRNVELEENYWWFVGVRAMVKNLLEVGRGKRRLGNVLDVDCGTGALLDQLAPHADEIWGVDIAEEAIELCKRRGHTDLVGCDACEIDFPDGSFDVLYLVPPDEWPTTLKDIHQSLNHVGRLLLKEMDRSATLKFALILWTGTK